MATNRWHDRAVGVFGVWLFLAPFSAALAQSAVPGTDLQRDRARATEVEKPEFRVLDKDGDDFISREEAAAAPDVLQRFEAVDRDKDGKLSRAEFEAALKPDATGNVGAARGGAGT